MARAHEIASPHDLHLIEGMMAMFDGAATLDLPVPLLIDASGTDLGMLGGRRGSVMGSYAHLIDQAPT